MFAILFALTTVGGFPYGIVTLSDRTKKAVPGDFGTPGTWHEKITTIVANDRKDADFSRYMQVRVRRLQRDYYNREVGGNGKKSFATKEGSGWVEAGADVVAASPDLVVVTMATGFYENQAAHPHTEDAPSLNWSRRLHRPLEEADVFATPPDRRLRRLAQARFDNRDAMQSPDDPDGLPLSWDHAIIGPKGITWSFGQYELGGYLSVGATTIGWADLKAYLRHSLPFAIAAIREAPPSN